MIKTYKSTDRIQLSEHFNCSEFKCKCNIIHNYLISDELITKLEQLFSSLNATKAIISSGYRCAAHDKAVGGNSTGQHTKGTACDIIFYGLDGKPISSKIVSCKAQDLGFTGIANIKKNYTYIHLDVRSSGRYYGDEYVSTHTVTNDFYSYYGISKSQTFSTTSGKWDNCKDDLIGQLQAILNSKGFKLQCDSVAGDKVLECCKKYTIQNGDRGILTKWVQTRLNYLGFSCGAVDGIAGRKTMSAIAEFQRANGLGIGYLGGNDWYYLIR